MNFLLWLRLGGQEHGAKRKSQNLLAQTLSPHAFRLTAHAYLITRSALASTLGGIVSPIRLAVLRLITNSNFVGCSTGISEGLIPFRILSMSTASRR